MNPYELSIDWMVGPITWQRDICDVTDYWADHHKIYRAVSGAKLYVKCEVYNRQPVNDKV